MTDPCSSLTEMIIELKGVQFQSVGGGGGLIGSHPQKHKHLWLSTTGTPRLGSFLTNATLS